MSFEIDEKTQKQVREFRKNDQNINHNHPNKWMRRVIVKKTTDEDILKDYALNDPFAKVRKEALRKIQDEEFLCQIVSCEKDNEVKRLALRKIKNPNLLSHIAQRDENCNIRMLLINRVNDEKLFENRAFVDPCPKIRAYSASKITNEEILKEIALGDDESDVRINAITNPSLNDQNLFEKLAGEYNDKNIKIASIRRMNNEEKLSKIAIESSFEQISYFACGKIQSDELLYNVAINTQWNETGKLATSKIRTDSLLVELIEDEKWPYVAMDNIENESTFRYLLDNNPDPGIKLCAMHELNSPCPLTQEELFEEIVNGPQKIALIAATKFYTSQIMLDFWDKNPSYSTRKRVILRLTDGRLLSKIALLEEEKYLIIYAIAEIDDEGVLRKTIYNSDNPRVKEALSDIKKYKGTYENPPRLVTDAMGKARDKYLQITATKSFGYLDNLIHSKEDKIVLDSDIALESGEEDIYRNGIDLDMYGLVIDGDEHSIDAKGKARIFNVTSHRIELRNIVLTNGYDEKGGAILNKGEIKIYDSTLKNNHAKMGGAIFNRGKAHIYRSNFQNNKSSLSGGAIENREAYKVRCNNSRFTDNSAKSCGGAICNQGVFEIGNCLLESNAAKKGGAIFTYPPKSKKIPNTRCIKTLCRLKEDECDFKDNEVDDTFEKPIF
jgi:hypothetical protein